MHDVDTVHDEGRVGQPDATVAQAAIVTGRMLVTLDRGFSAPATKASDHPGFVVLKLRDQSAPAVEAMLTHLMDQHDLEDLRGCIVIVSPGRVRIRRPH